MAVRRTRIQGARELDRTLKALPRQLGAKVLGGAVMSGAQEIRKAALANLGEAERGDVIARRTRQGKASVTVSVGPPKDKFYLMFREFGTAPHTIRPRRRGRKVLADKESGAVFGPEVRHPGQPARPFLRPAFEKFKPGAQRRFLARVAALTGMGGA